MKWEGVVIFIYLFFSGVFGDCWSVYRVEKDLGTISFKRLKALLSPVCKDIRLKKKKKKNVSNM